MAKNSPPNPLDGIELPEKLIRKLSELLKATELSEIEISQADFKIRVRGKVESTESIVLPSRPSPVLGSAAPSSASKPEATDGDLQLVRSPFVGTFYKASSPDAEAFVQVGQSVSKGQTLCIVEAMKVMNEIESDVSGIVEKVFADNGMPVDFNAPLFGIRSSSG
ncbi:MAG: acetyl-CoA carboxylase biotin carboxyl carrier protein [Bradymonadales bacterium]|nr:MAG: acetyl-CoA carboxylase biotin carboxyl carrier protein [Bradymonadales bacterium]